MNFLNRKALQERRSYRRYLHHFFLMTIISSTNYYSNQKLTFKTFVGDADVLFCTGICVPAIR